MDPTIAAAGINFLGGLFKGKSQGPMRSMGETALGARKWAKETGFNALTLLGLGGGVGGVPTGNAPPPLASLSILTDAIADKYGDDGKARREHNELQNELLRLEVQRARTLSVVAPAASVAGGGALTGGRVQTRIAGPTAGYLDETDRNPAVADERDNTVSFQSHGQSTTVPVGPDMDEVISGALIEANNKKKASEARMSMGPMDKGTPLAIPPGFVDRTWELMPPSNAMTVKKSPRPKRNTKPRYDATWIN